MEVQEGERGLNSNGKMQLKKRTSRTKEKNTMTKRAGKFAKIKIFMMLFIKTHYKQNKRYKCFVYLMFVIKK